jgi:hypothetical protein
MTGADIWYTFKLWFTNYTQNIANSACYVYDGFLHPQFDDDTPIGADPTGPASDPYDRSQDLNSEQAATDAECGAASRT